MMTPVLRSFLAYLITGRPFGVTDPRLQCLDGTHYAFPKAMKQAREAGKYDKVFKLWEDVKARPNIAGYLTSDRRQNYQDWGIYRHYEDNDVVAE